MPVRLAVPSRLILVALQLVGFLLSAPAVSDALESADDLRIGETGVVNADSTVLMIDTQTHRLLNKGTPVKIVSHQDSWFQVEVHIGDKLQTGWLRGMSVSRAESATPTPSAKDADRSGDGQKSGGEPVKEMAGGGEQGERTTPTLAEKFKQLLAEKGRSITEKSTAQGATSPADVPSPEPPSQGTPEGPAVETSESKKPAGIAQESETEEPEKATIPTPQPSGDAISSETVPPSTTADETAPPDAAVVGEPDTAEFPTEQEMAEGPEQLAEKFAEALSARREELRDRRASSTTSVLVLQDPTELSRVSSEKQIERLVLTGDQITDRSLKGLAGLSVSVLSIEAINVSNAGLRYVSEMRGIHRLRLWSPGIDDDALKLIAQLKDLEVLDLEGTAIVGTAFADLQDLPKLRMLVLGPKVTDAAISGLRPLTTLRQLDLRTCRNLSLACLESVARLSNLELVWLPDHLRVQGTKILGSSLPKCQVRS